MIRPVRGYPARGRVLLAALGLFCGAAVLSLLTRGSWDQELRIIPAPGPVFAVPESSSSSPALKTYRRYDDAEEPLLAGGPGTVPNPTDLSTLPERSYAPRLRPVSPGESLSPGDSAGRSFVYCTGFTSASQARAARDRGPVTGGVLVRDGRGYALEYGPYFEAGRAESVLERLAGTRGRHCRLNSY